MITCHVRIPSAYFEYDVIDTFEAYDKIVNACVEYVCYQYVAQLNLNSKAVFDGNPVQHLPSLPAFHGIFHLFQCRRSQLQSTK